VTISWDRLARPAWQARENAHAHGPTRVGAAVLASDGRVFAGCNVEHRFRSHDVHAEVNALSTMVAEGSVRAVAVLIAAERDHFTPCGSCLDWIFELGGPGCLIAFQAHPDSELQIHSSRDLMPYYPS
jgi:cytidine deaminase